ncbi:uncharacterized protein LOC128236392 [Mya arenaria]|nr:uncharacterized protein LOC128236392 [Mya arenaria]
MDMKYLVTIVLLCIVTLGHVSGHGRLTDPPGRSSAWRFGFKTPINYNDNSLECGGFPYQYSPEVNGRCGACGDPYFGPFNNEAGGRYAQGVLVRNYTEGQTIRVTLDITANHGGYSEFRICANNDVSKRVTQECLNEHLLKTPSGESRYLHENGNAGKGIKHVDLILPYGLTCTQCVFQWKWKTNSGNNCGRTAGCCDPSNIGCGPQDEFRGCADVSIVPYLYILGK